MSNEKNSKDFICPMLNKRCIGDKCAWHTVMHSTINGNLAIDHGCAMSFLPGLLVQNANLQNQTGAAIESFRNEMVKSNEISQQLFFSTNKNLIGS